MKFHKLCAATLAAMSALSAGAALAMTPSSVDFSHGMQNWYGDDGTVAAIDSALGNGTPAFHAVGGSSGFALKTIASADFLGNYTALKSLNFSLDVTVAELAIGSHGGVPITQDLVLELRDYDKPGVTQAYSSVWYRLGLIGEGQPSSQHLSVTIADTSANTLPAGWGGDGDDGMTGPQLPYGQTFRRVLTDVDEVVISTYLPGYTFGSSQYYNLAIDNIAISAVPEGDPALLMLAGLGLLGWVARHKRSMKPS